MRPDSETVRWWMQRHGDCVGGNMRRVYECVHVFGMSERETAAEVGISRSTVHDYLTRLAIKTGWFR